MNMRGISGYDDGVSCRRVPLSGKTPEAGPAFEAAFIKANTTGSGGSSSNGTKGQLVMVNQSLRRLVERAYNVKAFQVIGAGVA